MTDYEKLREIYIEIDSLISKKVTSASPEFAAWKNKTERFLIKHFKNSSYEIDEFRKTSFSPMIFFSGQDSSEFISKCKSGLLETQAIFATYLEEMASDSRESSSCENGAGISQNYSKVFIVHGHDSALRESVARLLEKQEITPIILNEQVNQGATIIEKFEQNSHVSAAICLFTADDTVQGDNGNVGKKRARQNVVFETGYFMGKLGRDHTVLLADKGVEMPSDLQGVVYTNTESWKVNVLQELKAIGYSIDFNKYFS